MIVGVSRVQQALACRRQWWFGEVAGVTLPHSYGQVFGNVLHACVERWLKEEPVYPAGWQWCPESKQRIDGPNDDALIQSMVDQAVEKGFLRRHPDRRVEHTWWTILETAPSSKQFDYVLVARGTIDLCEPGVIVDHKGSKNVAYYAKTKAELRTNLQLLVYLYVNENSRGLIHKPDDLLTVGHINYCRATGNVTEKTVQVTWQAAHDAWTTFVQTARRLLPLAQEKDLRQVPCALDEPLRADGKRACDDYAGCGYLPICSAKDKLGEFEKFKTRNLRAALPPKARLDFQRSIEDMVNKTKAPKRVEPADDEDEDEAPAPKAKAKKPANPFDDEEVDEDEEPAPPPRKAKKPAPEPEEDEDEEPAPSPKPKRKPAPEPEDEDEDEEPAPPPRKAKPAPEPDEDDPIEAVKAGGEEAYREILAGLSPKALIKRLVAIRAAVLGND